MTLINPGSPAATVEIISNLTKNAALRLGIEISQYDSTKIQDNSGKIFWMYSFDTFENRIFRVQNGLQEFRNLDLGTDGFIDPDSIADQIAGAISELDRTDLNVHFSEAT